MMMMMMVVVMVMVVEDLHASKLLSWVTVGDDDESNAEEELDGRLADLDVQGLSACDGRFKKYFSM